MKKILRSCHKGSAILLMPIILAVVTAFVAFSVTKLTQVSYGGLSSSTISMQAQQYAYTKAEYLRSVDYDELANEDVISIPNSDSYFEEVLISSESAYPLDNDIKQKICTINIFKDEEPLPRCSLSVVRLSKQDDSGLPSGSIISWYGNLSEIPSGFLLCNGSNGTPDLRDKFIVGAGSSYELSATGGANTVKLSSTQIGNHYHFTGWHNNNNTGRYPTTAGTLHNPSFPSGYSIAKWNGSGGGGYSGYSCSGWNMITSLAVATAAQEAHENRPPYYALYYLMKL